MTRWLPAFAGMAVGLAVLGLAVTGAVGGDRPPEPTVPVSTASGPYCDLEPKEPCPPGPELLADDSDGYQPPISAFVPPINGFEIPLPEGATVGTVLSEPGGLSYMYTRGSSRLQFETNGWMIRYEVADEDRSDFEPTVEALFTAAPPVTVNGEAIRVPRGATYQYPYLPTLLKITSGFQKRRRIFMSSGEVRA